jgi:hypothetical protein
MRRRPRVGTSDEDQRRLMAYRQPSHYMSHHTTPDRKHCTEYNQQKRE